MPDCDAYRASAPFAKFVPLSVMILFGTPYLTVMSITNLTAVGPSSFLIGLASIHLVNLSTATNKCVMPPLAVLNGPTMSNPHTANAQLGGLSKQIGPSGSVASPSRSGPELFVAHPRVQRPVE